jgi:hypothetical protein
MASLKPKSGSPKCAGGGLGGKHNTVAQAPRRISQGSRRLRVHVPGERGISPRLNLKTFNVFLLKKNLTAAILTLGGKNL